MARFRYCRNWFIKKSHWLWWTSYRNTLCVWSRLSWNIVVRIMAEKEKILSGSNAKISFRNWKWIRKMHRWFLVSLTRKTIIYCRLYNSCRRYRTIVASPIDRKMVSEPNTWGHGWRNWNGRNTRRRRVKRIKEEAGFDDVEPAIIGQ